MYTAHGSHMTSTLHNHNHDNDYILETELHMTSLLNLTSHDHLLLFIDMSRTRHINKQEQVRGQILIRQTKCISNIFILIKSNQYKSGT